MADEEQLQILRQGVDAWNEWRGENPDKEVDLSEAHCGETNLSGAALEGANLSNANLGNANLGEANLTGAALEGAFLRGANLEGAFLDEANLRGAHLDEANLRGATLWKADLTWAYLEGTNLRGADLDDADLDKAYLHGANLEGAKLRGANLSNADLSRAQLIGTDLCDATLTGSSIYGVSVWAIEVNGRTKQQNLIITPRNEPVITVDNIRVAQFIYLLLNNQEIRDAIDTVGRKLVLILGRFTPERKRLLDALRDELRRRNYLPVVFDFQKPASRDLTETISRRAGDSGGLQATTDLNGDRPDSLPIGLAPRSSLPNE
jgi:uncharacterized protein YjbI with pentapeptide repeats